MTPYRWAAGIGAAVLVLSAGAAAARAATEPIPPLRERVLLGAQATVPGPPPTLAWPAVGEAALAYSDGTLIGTSGPVTAVPIASVTKVMTAYLVLEDHPLQPGEGGFSFTITPSESANIPARLAKGQSLLRVHTGEIFTERQALDALLLASADNMATALARVDAGTVAAFVAKMNTAASALDMAHTHFAGPSGYNPASVSTAGDLLRLARAAMAVPEFARIVGKPSATIPGVATFPNYNSLVGTDGFTGIKTGSTGAAGQALLFSLRRTVAGETVSVVGCVLRQQGPGVVGGALQAAKKLADSYYSELAPRTVVPAGTAVAAITRAGRSTIVAIRSPLQVLALPGSTIQIGVTVNLRADGGVDAIVRASGPAGSARGTAGGRTPPPPGVGWRLRRLLP